MFHIPVSVEIVCCASETCLLRLRGVFLKICVNLTRLCVCVCDLMSCVCLSRLCGVF